MPSIKLDPDLLKRHPTAFTQADVELRNRFLGVLPGLALGDALGAPVEFRSQAELAASHPDGVREITGGGIWKPGEPTDDTQLALQLAESLAAATRLDLNDLCARLVRWLNSKPKDVGNLTRASLENLRAGDAPSESGAIAWEDSGRKAAGNGSVMYCAPLGLLHLRAQDALVDDASAVSRVTHYDPRCVGGCVAVATAIAGLVRGDDDAFERAARAGGTVSDDVRAVIERAEARPPEALRVDGADRGYVLVTLELAFSALAHAESFEDGLVRVVSRGGDADTNGAVAGALLGARFGRSALPERWTRATLAVPRLGALGETLYKVAMRR
jgi:ADP-ribosyl-[dinitrogen reductase] hydrolase